jgi:MATE family multidrug resistance protein
MVIYLWLLLRYKKRSAQIVKNIKFFVLDITKMKIIINLGSLSAIQMFFEVAIFTAAIWLSGLLGKNPQAANQIALNLSSMAFMVAIGLSVASVIRVGNQKGLQNFKELRRIAFSIFFLGIVLAIIFAIIFFVFHKILPTIYVDLNDKVNYTDNMEVISIASKLLIAVAFF